MGKTTLDYRLPDTGAHRVRRIANALEQEQVIEWGFVLLRFAAGLGMCCILPLILTKLFGGLYRPRWLFFLSAFAVTVPPLLFFERLQASSIVWEQTQVAWDRSRLFQLPFLPRYSTVLDFGAALLLFAGPRLVMSAVDELRQPDYQNQETRILAGRIVAYLLDAHQSVPMHMLLGIDPDRTSLERALRFLNNRGWLFVSPRHDRVSLAESIRKELANLA